MTALERATIAAPAPEPLQAIDPPIAKSDRDDLAAAGDVGASPSLHVPGYCSDHSNRKLVTHRRAGVTWWSRSSRTDLAVVCIDPAHTPYDRERCMWCGGSLDETGLGRFSPKRGFCRRRGDMCRIDAHRARRRGRAHAPAAIR